MPAARIFLVTDRPVNARPILRELGVGPVVEVVPVVPRDLQPLDAVVLLARADEVSVTERLLSSRAAPSSALMAMAGVAMARGAQVVCVINELLPVEVLSDLAQELGVPVPITARDITGIAPWLAEQRGALPTVRMGQYVPPTRPAVGGMALQEPTVGLALLAADNHKVRSLTADRSALAFAHLHPDIQAGLRRNPTLFGRIAGRHPNPETLFSGPPPRETLLQLRRDLDDTPRDRACDRTVGVAWVTAAALWGDDDLLTWAMPHVVHLVRAGVLPNTAPEAQEGRHLGALSVGLRNPWLLGLLVWTARQPAFEAGLDATGAALGAHVRQARRHVLQAIETHGVAGVTVGIEQIFGAMGYGWATPQAVLQLFGEEAAQAGERTRFVTWPGAASVPGADARWPRLRALVPGPPETPVTLAELVLEIERAEADGSLSKLVDGEEGVEGIWDVLTDVVTGMHLGLTPVVADRLAEWLQRPRRKHLRVVGALAKGIERWPVLTPGLIRGLWSVAQYARSYQLEGGATSLPRSQATETLATQCLRRLAQQDVAYRARHDEPADEPSVLTRVYGLPHEDPPEWVAFRMPAPPAAEMSSDRTAPTRLGR